MADTTERTNVPANADREFPGYPEGYLLAGFESAASADEAIQRISALGVSTTDMVKYAGPAGAAILDSDGTNHGIFAMFERAVEWIATDEDHLALYEEKAASGGTIIGVKIPDEDLRNQAIDILHSLDATDMKHFGRLQVEVIRR